MIKMFVLLRKKAGFTEEDFRKFWRAHGNVVKSGAPIVKYIQYDVQESPFSMPGFEKNDPPVDGIAEVWVDVDSEEDIKKVMETSGFGDLMSDQDKMFDRDTRSIHFLFIKEAHKVV